MNVSLAISGRSQRPEVSRDSVKDFRPDRKEFSYVRDVLRSLKHVGFTLFSNKIVPRLANGTRPWIICLN